MNIGNIVAFLGIVVIVAVCVYFWLDSREPPNRGEIKSRIKNTDEKPSSNGFRPRKPLPTNAPPSRPSTPKIAPRGPRMRGAFRVNPTALCLKTGKVARDCDCELHKDIE